LYNRTRHGHGFNSRRLHQCTGDGIGLRTCLRSKVLWVRKVRIYINKCMNYQRIYDNLISYRLQNPATGYTEKHHILMKSMGGSDDPDNLVVLTGREHWIAHLLLYKIHKNSQTIHACHMMAMMCEERDISYIKNSRLYEEVRKHHAELASKRMKISQAGVNNTQYGTRWICNLELKQNKKISKDCDIPDGWLIGRNLWNSISRDKAKAETKTNSLIAIDKAKSITNEKYLKLIDDYCKGNFISINQFSKICNIHQRVLSNIFRRFGYSSSSRRKAYSSADARKQRDINKK